MLPLTDPVLIVAVAMLVFLIAPAVAERVRVPGLIGVIVCGAVLGPNAIGLLERDATIVLLGTVGLLYLVFLAGLELDLHRFAQYRRPSIAFGVLSFGIPAGLAAMVMPWLGFDLHGTLLIGAIVGSHTLLAYPIASRLGLIGNRAVTVVVGGTLVTDTLALALLAVVTGAVGGGIGLGFWLRLIAVLSLYVVVIAFGVPWLGRWFFRRTPGQPATEFLFLMTVLFVTAYLATVAGAQPIIGAFLAGLTLNRLIPNEGPNMNRVRFVGNAFFVPFFLLSVGMLVDPRVLLGSERLWVLAGALILLVHLGKAAAALLSRSIFGYSGEEAMIAFGLSLPQAAATLAVTFVGLEIGLFDENVVNAVVLMILVTCLVGPSLVERFGQAVALAEEALPIRGGEMPQRIMVPMANPATARDLMDLALIIREPGTREPIYPVTVVPSELSNADQYVAEAEKMLSHAVAHAAAADTTVIPVTRMDHNFANGIARAVAETRSSTLIIGWDGRRSPRRVIFGTVLDQLLELTRQQVLVAKLGHPLNTTRRIVLLLPQGSDHLPGFHEAVRTIKRAGNQLGAQLVGYTVRGRPQDYLEYFERVNPRVPTRFQAMGSWEQTLRQLPDQLGEDDLVVVMSARRGAVSWVSTLERLPAILAQLVPESFIMMYPSEAIGSQDRILGGEWSIPPSLSPSRTLFGLPPQPFTDVLEQLLETEFGRDRERWRAMRQEVFESDGLSWEMLPGVVIPHVRIAGLREPILFLGVSPSGIAFPDIAEPARLIFLLLTPEDRPQQHLAELSSIARMVSDPMRLRGLVAARDFDDLLHAVEQQS